MLEMSSCNILHSVHSTNRIWEKRVSDLYLFPELLDLPLSWVRCAIRFIQAALLFTFTGTTHIDWRKNGSCTSHKNYWKICAWEPTISSINLWKFILDLIEAKRIKVIHSINISIIGILPLSIRTPTTSWLISGRF